jgi:hypothetical protein
MTSMDVWLQQQLGARPPDDDDRRTEKYGGQLPPKQCGVSPERQKRQADDPRHDPLNVIAVGTALTGGPPHRSQRAELPHWAPASGSGVEACLREWVHHANAR